jgi:hypothetical protein
VNKLDVPKEDYMQFLSCYDTDCRTIVALDPKRGTVSECPVCGKPLLKMPADEGRPMGYDQRSIDPLVEKHGAAYWHVGVCCVESLPALRLNKKSTR